MTELEIDNLNEAEYIAIRGWEAEPDSEMKKRVLEGLYLQVEINTLGKENLTEEQKLKLAELCK